MTQGSDPCPHVQSKPKNLERTSAAVDGKPTNIVSAPPRPFRVAAAATATVTFPGGKDDACVHGPVCNGPGSYSPRARLPGGEVHPWAGPAQGCVERPSWGGGSNPHGGWAEPQCTTLPQLAGRWGGIREGGQVILSPRGQSGGGLPSVLCQHRGTEPCTVFLPG